MVALSELYKFGEKHLLERTILSTGDDFESAHQPARFVLIYNFHAHPTDSQNSPQILAPKTMAPSALQGLNLVHPVQQSYLGDSQDLLSASHFPELNAQLDLWTNLAFQSDEPLLTKDDHSNHHRVDTSANADDFDRDDDDDDDASPSGPANADSHDNVVLGNQVPTSASHSASVQQQPPFDLAGILAGLGVDPFSSPFQLPQNQFAAAPSLQQILSLYPTHNFPTQPPAPLSAPAAAPTGKQSELQSAPPAKRARTRKTSISTTVEDGLDSVAASPDTPDSSTPLTPAEDKRRRNTAASARFRLKKKEREAALEKKAKELENRVAELERECEGLRRENGWLKGLVVGVTGAGSQQQSAGVKRTRDGDDA